MGQWRRITFIQNGSRVDACHSAEVADRIDDHVEVVPPIAVCGDQDLGAPRSVGENRWITGVLVHNILAAVDHRQIGGADQLFCSCVVGGQIHRIFGPKTGLAQRFDEPVRGERLAMRRADRYPIAQCQRLRPQAVNAQSISRSVHAQHLAPARPYRAAGSRARFAPVPGCADRPGGLDRVAGGDERFSHTAAAVTGRRHGQAGHQAGEFDVRVEVQSCDRRVHEDVSGLGQPCRTLVGRQRPRLALGADRAGDVERWHDAQLGNRHAGGVGDDVTVSRPAVTARTESVDRYQYTPSMTGSPSKIATGAISLIESPTWPGGPGRRIAVSRSRLFGMNIPLLMWFMTTWPRAPYGTSSAVSGSTTQNTT